MLDREITDFVDQRSKSSGRRETDGTCAMHDYAFGKNDQCLGIIKESIKEEVSRRDHKLELLESRMEAFITKWSLGIMVTISSMFIGIIFGLLMWQMKALKDDVNSIGKNWNEGNRIAVESMNKFTVEVTKMGIRQAGILIELENIAPEHKLLMEHMRKEN